MSNKKIVTIQFEVLDSDVPDLQTMERDGALDDVAECLATLKDRRVVKVIFSDWPRRERSPAKPGPQRAG